MKTKIYFLPILLLGCLSLFLACGDDEDDAVGQPSTSVEGEGGGQPSTPGEEEIRDQPCAPVIGSGARLSVITQTIDHEDDKHRTHFQYNQDGTIRRIIDTYDLYGNTYWTTITYNPFRIENSWYDELKNFSFNNSGFITHYIIEENDAEKEHYESHDFYYNVDGTLSKIVNSVRKASVQNGVYNSYEGSETSTYSWTNGNIAQIEVAKRYVENGSPSNYSVTYTFEYTDKINKYRQCVVYVGAGDYDYELFAHIGWLGKWTKKYPASCTISSVGANGKLYTRTSTWSDFSTTSDGLLSGFDRDGQKFTYIYDNTASTAKKAAGM